MVAKAKNERFERRVRRIAQGPVETKTSRWQPDLAAGIAPSYEGPAYAWALNPMGGVQRQSDNSASNHSVIGDEFILRGLLFNFMVSTNNARVFKMRVSLISFDWAPENTSLNGFPIALGPPIFMESGDTATTPTLISFDVDKVNVLESREYRAVPQFDGSGLVIEGRIYWSTDQKKTIYSEAGSDVVPDEYVDRLKGRNYYWVVEMLYPSATSASWSPVGGDFVWSANSVVYFKDA